MVVSPFSWKRARTFVAHHGLRALGKRATKMASGGAADLTARFMREQGVEARSLKRWCRSHHVDYRVVSTLNNPDAVNLVKTSNADGVVYCGGGILRRAFLDAARGRVLNAHAGPLPAVRGMNACEWALLLGLRPEVTIHFIDEGIDTGPALELIPVEVAAGDDIQTVRQKAVLAGVQGLARHASAVTREMPLKRSMPLSRQCFVLAPALHDLLSAKLAGGGAHAW